MTTSQSRRRSALAIAHLLLAVTILVSGSKAKAQDITYALVPYQSSGWTLTGSITTDGKVGSLLPADILSWSYQFTNGAQVFDSEEGGGDATAGALFAWPGDLQVNGPLVNYIEDIYPPVGPALGNTYVVWGELSDGEPGCMAFDVGPPGNGSMFFEAAAPQTVPISYDYVTVATVPEPATLVLLGVAAIGLLGHVWRRRPGAKT